MNPKKIVNRVFKIIAAGAGILILNPAAHACKCAPQDREAAIRQSTAIFAGKVTAISGPQGTSQYRNVSFQVEKAWKGVTGHRTQVKTGTVLMCGYEFQIGKKYLVYASNNPPVTSSCERTRPLETASADVEALGKSTPLK